MSVFRLRMVGFFRWGCLCLILLACQHEDSSSGDGNGDGDSNAPGDGDREGISGDGDGDPAPIPDGTPAPPRDDGCTAAPAADFDPTQGYEWQAVPVDVVVTTSADDGPGSFREVLAQVEEGQVIGFDASLAGETIQLSEQLVVTKSITIDASGAPGITLDGQGKSRLLQYEKALDSVIVGLTLKNGRADEDGTLGEGGGIKVSQADRGDVDNPKPNGSIEVVGCRFENNVGAGAGALFVGWRIDALVRDSVFVENEATEGTDEQKGKSGGAIATRQNASLVVRRSTFLRNRGAKCGGVYNILEPIEVEDSVFIDNEATSGSGALFTDGGNGVGPSNDPDTGADGTMIVRRVRMSGNVGTGDGGAMLLWGYPRDVLVIESSVIADSSTSGDKGGGARLHGLAEVRIIDSTFAGNHSEQQGGGFWLDGTGDVELTNVTFSGNSVTRDAGGGFTYNGEGALILENCTFAYNDAGRAAGGFWMQPSVQGMVSNSIFAFNTVGDNLGERHIGPRPADGGGNIDFALTDQDKGRTFEGAIFADPMIADLEEVNGVLLHTLQEDSPAIGHATGSAPARDARGGVRDASPDAGAHEFDAECQ